TRRPRPVPFADRDPLRAHLPRALLLLRPRRRGPDRPRPAHRAPERPRHSPAPPAHHADPRHRGGAAPLLRAALPEAERPAPWLRAPARAQRDDARRAGHHGTADDAAVAADHPPVPHPRGGDRRGLPAESPPPREDPRGPGEGPRPLRRARPPHA